MTLSLEILDQLVAFDTVSDRSNLDLIAYIESFLVSRGFRTHRIPDPELEKAGLYAEIGPNAEGGLLLSAHSDVVPVAGQSWTKPPFKLMQEGDLFYGRGTTDMKGFLAEMLAVADIASRTTLKEPLKLLISYDEEVGCTGIAKMQTEFQALLGKPRVAIVGEPTEMQVATGHKGKRSYQAQITGEAGHSALSPRFVSALQIGVDFVLALRELQDDLQRNGAKDCDYDISYSTVHVGKLNSGTALNIVPDKAELLFEFRHLAEDNPDVLEARVEALADAVVSKVQDRAAIKLKRLAAYPGLETSREHPAVTAALRWSEQDTCKVAFGTEAGFFADLNIPTIVCGPGSMSGQGHKADEYIARSQLLACSQMLGKALESIQ